MSSCERPVSSGATRRRTPSVTTCHARFGPAALDVAAARVELGLQRTHGVVGLAQLEPQRAQLGRGVALVFLWRLADPDHRARSSLLARAQRLALLRRRVELAYQFLQVLGRLLALSLGLAASAARLDLLQARLLRDLGARGAAVGEAPRRADRSQQAGLVGGLLYSVSASSLSSGSPACRRSIIC